MRRRQLENEKERTIATIDYRDAHAEELIHSFIFVSFTLLPQILRFMVLLSGWSLMKAVLNSDDSGNREKEKAPGTLGHRG